ncbi:unnamed protein product [Staurois parvus]|uniref:Uncharacterized protein n=1 Tax=Staurois parvus TaxID=386267 RepID=A0ABN9CET8_9NEOB|nr:unnamed protein product [Staurois parvus]
MRRCSGGPCSTYLVLRSHDVSPAASPRPSPPADAGIRLLCSGPRDVGTYGRPPAGNLKNVKVIYFFFQF